MSISKGYFQLVVAGADSRRVKQIEPLVFALRDGEEYSFRLINVHRTRKATAKISIDEKEVVCVTIDNKSSTTVDRYGDDDASKFTFSKATCDASEKPIVLQIDFELEPPAKLESSNIRAVRNVTVDDGLQSKEQTISTQLDITTIRAIIVLEDDTDAKVDQNVGDPCVRQYRTAGSYQPYETYVITQ